jgi:uncharacterized cofD-like protein
MHDGSRVVGETKITASEKRIMELKTVPENPEPLPETLKAISDADLVTLGPGSLFTSLIPNLLVRGVPEAIAGSRAVKVFICNLMTQANESLHMSASEHIGAVYKQCGHRIFDYALVNSAPVSPKMKVQYAGEQAEQVACDVAAIENLGVRCLTGNFVEENHFARHSTDLLCQEILGILQIHRSGMSLTTGKG